MNARIWGIIGGVALVLALLSPLVLGSAQKVESLFEAAEALYERSDYESAIGKYKEALKESKKLGAKTERIDKDFTTLANLKIARCYYELAEDSSDVRHYQRALIHIREVESNTQVVKHQEELTYLWAETLYKTEDLDQAESKFSGLIEKFPNSQWVSKALYAIGDINTKQENYNEALSAFQKIVDEFPNSDWAPRALYTIGDIHYKQQQHNETLNAFQKLIAEFPHSELKAEAERRIAEIEDLDNNDTPPDPECETEAKAMYNAASNLKQQGRVHDAYQRYTDLITLYPDSQYVTNAYVGKAEIHLEVEDYVNVRANYEEAMYSTDDAEQKTEIYKKYQLTYLVPVYADGERTPEDRNDVLRFIDATRLRKEGKFLEAAKLYEILAESNLPAENTIKALYWTGYCYYKAALTNPNLFNKSVNAFKRLIGNYSIGAHTIEAYYYLTLVYADWAQIPGNKSKCQSVIDTVEEANAKYTDNDDARNRGWLNRMQELKEKTIQKLNPPPVPPNPVPDPDPDPVPDPVLLVDQGYIHLGRGELEEATKKARKALDINPDYQLAHQLLSAIKETYYGRGWTFFDEEQYEKAIDAFKNATNIDPKFKEAHCHLGVIYIEQQRYNRAVKALEKATEIDPRFKEAHFNLALVRLRSGEFELAKNAANAALEIDPNYEPARILIDFIAD